MNKMIVGISAAAMAAGLGLGATTLATAEDTPTPGATVPAPEARATEQGGRQAREGRQGPRQARTDEERAQRRAACQDEQARVLEQAVEDGTLTQNEADAVQKAIDEGLVGLRGKGPRR